MFVLHTRRILHRKMNRCDCGIPESREERHFDEGTNIAVCINIGESVLGSQITKGGLKKMLFFDRNIDELFDAKVKVVRGNKRGCVN